MARISKVPVKRHDGKATLAPRHVIVVRVASFAFRFETVERLRECIKYYEKKHALAVEFQLRPWPQTSGNIGENYGDGTWSAGLNASRCICWKNPSVRRCSKLCAEPWLWLKPGSCNFPNSEPGHRASGKRLPEKLALSHSSIAVLRPRFSLCDEGILRA